MNTVFKPINWMQGMNVSSAHFIATENFMTERMMKYVELLQGKFSFGLLPSSSALEEEDAMALEVVGKGKGTKLVLYSYHGLTQGGCYIDLETNDESVSCDCVEDDSIVSDGWDVVLSVAPFDRRPCGEPNIQENPPRYPFVEPVYRLTLVAREKDQINEYGPCDVVIGHLIKKDDLFKLDGRFIPPSLTMSSYSTLIQYMKVFSQQIASIKESVGTIIEKAYSPNANRSDVLLNVIEICKDIQREIARDYFTWRNEGMSLAPVQVIQIISSLSNAILTSLTFMSKQGKDDVLKYFYEWNGITPSAFEQVLDDLVRLKFNQNRIEQSMNAAEEVLQMLVELFISLSRLDYVGQHKESMVVSVSSVKEEQPEAKKTSWLL